MSLKLELEDFEEPSDSDVEKSDNKATIPAKPTGILSSIKNTFTRPKCSSPPEESSFATHRNICRTFLVLKDFLQPDTTKSLEETALTLLSIIPDGKSRSAEIRSAGEVFIEVAGQVPYSHPSQLKLAALIKRLSWSDKFISRPDEKGTIYSCGTLAETMGDSYYGPNDVDTQEWPNLSAFFAHIDALRIHTDRNTFAVRAMRDAFEREPEEVFTFPGKRDQCIIAAAQYVLWNGQNLFTATQYCGDVSDPRPWSDEGLYRGELGQNLQRWRFWKAGFHSAADDSALGNEARDIARRSASLMEVFEGSMLF
ncbi:DUF3632 domain-containing protein [Aspergillus stella-maris]|uniref:DUF3632 domain-containing protein n=1 Tax=Aspergillus stella-maris TaxID=1810926 RepID=UPI003CCDDAE5